jgi:hypothetical protein
VSARQQQSATKRCTSHGRHHSSARGYAEALPARLVGFGCQRCHGRCTRAMSR